MKARTGLPILTDIHEPAHAARVADVADVIQIPAFLSRQTDLIVAAARTGKVVNVKKGQFLAPKDMRHVIAKITAEGNESVLVTERGVSFGYNNLVVDMRAFPMLRELGYPVVFDVTHSLQLPGAGDGVTAAWPSTSSRWPRPASARASMPCSWRCMRSPRAPRAMPPTPCGSTSSKPCCAS